MASWSIVFREYLLLLRDCVGFKGVLYRQFVYKSIYKKTKNAIIEFFSIITYFLTHLLLIFKQLHVINRSSITFFNQHQYIRDLYDLRWIFFLRLHSHRKGVNLNNRYFHHGSEQFFAHGRYSKLTFFRYKKTYFRSNILNDLIT